MDDTTTKAQLQDTLADKEVIISEDLRAALNQYLVMRKDDVRLVKRSLGMASLSNCHHFWSEMAFGKHSFLEGKRL